MVQIVKRASDVRISEINLSQVIASTSASVACLPIISKQGSSSPLLFSNGNDFLAEYGNPDPSISMTIQSGLNYFSEGNQLWGLRIVGTGAMYSCLLLYIDTDGSTKLRGLGLADPRNTDLSTLVTSGQSAVSLFYAGKGQGSYGDKLSIAVTTNSLTVPTGLTASASGIVGTLPNGNYKYIVSARALGGATMGSTPATVTLSGLASPTGANDLAWTPVPGAVGYDVFGRLATGTFGLLATVGATVTTFTDNGSLAPDTAKQPITDPLLAYVSSVFNVTVYDNTNPNARYLESWPVTLTSNVDSAGTQTQIEDRINPFSSYIQVVSNVAMLSSVPAIKSVTKTAFAGGNSGAAPTSYQISNALQVFSNNQLYKANLFINAGVADPVLQLALDTLVQARGDAVALLDVPAVSQKTQAAMDYRNLTLNLNSSYSALFNPDLLQADLINGQQVYSPPSGFVAALCARTDRVANPAFSPAGLNRGLVNVMKQRYQFDDGQASALFNAQVNYFRTFVGQGTALWEQQTLSAEFSALSWLSVRRITNVIKVSLYQFLLYALQEMNSDAVRRQLINGCDAYLSTIKNSGGLYDYNVTCDNSNNQSAAGNAGILVLSVVLVPAIPIHEIQLQVIISKRGVSFSETLSAVGGNTQ